MRWLLKRALKGKGSFAGSGRRSLVSTFHVPFGAPERPNSLCGLGPQR